MSNRLKQGLWLSMFGAAAALAVSAVRVVAVPNRGQVGADLAVMVIRQERVMSGNGTTRVGSTQTRAVRSDGSTVLKLGGAETGSRIIWFASGVEVTTNDRLRLKSTIRKMGASADHREPGTGCADSRHEKWLGEERVAGYRTARVKTSGDRNLLTWYALDHGCAIVKSRMDFGNGQASEWDLITLVSGEPPEYLFTVPADYKEGPPSALQGPLSPEHALRCGPECQQQERLRNQRMDEGYYKNRP